MQRLFEGGLKLPAVEACLRGKAPRHRYHEPYSGSLRYSYHVDAARGATYFEERTTRLGVRHVRDDVVTVSLQDDGQIAAVRTRDHGVLTADLYLDCSGFRSVLLADALGEPFLSFSPHVLCDRAIAAQTAYADNASIPAYTTARAMRHGWLWDIPLFSRRGVGYVYSSGHVSDDEAERDFRRALGTARFHLEPRRIRMRVGRSRRFWVNNCVGVGLAAGFIEPLESTGIYLIEVALRCLIDTLRRRRWSPHEADRFNRLLAQVYDDIRDFVVLHYAVSNRNDTEFWRDNNIDRAPLSLRARLAVWEAAPPSKWDVPSRFAVFDEHS
jgi:tryptophan halogenase